jgi:polyhydroxyalkanoate synthesis regulator phasin
MTGPAPTPPDPGETGPSGPDRVADAVRAAVERTMRATAGSASTSRERATDLVDDIVRRGREARNELARRGQEAGAVLARRGQDATGEMGRRLELLERRLAELEGRLAAAEPTARQTPADPASKPEAEG